MKNKNTVVIGFLSFIAAIVSVPVLIGYAEGPTGGPPSQSVNSAFYSISAGYDATDTPDQAASFKAKNYAVWGVATEPSGTGGLFQGDFGVSGESNSANGYGVKGTATDALGFGVMGTNTDADGTAASFSNRSGSANALLGTPNLGVIASYTGSNGAAGQFTATAPTGETYTTVLGGGSYNGKTFSGLFESKDSANNVVSSVTLSDSSAAINAEGAIRNSGLTINADGTISTGAIGLDVAPVKIVDSYGLRLESTVKGFESVVDGTGTAGIFTTSGNNGISVTANGTNSTGGSFTGTNFGVTGTATNGVGVAGFGTTQGVIGTATDAAGYGVVGTTTASSGTAGRFYNQPGTTEVNLGTPTIGVLGTYRGLSGSAGKFVGTMPSGNKYTAILGDATLLNAGVFTATDSTSTTLSSINLANATNAIEATGIIKNAGLTIAANGDLSSGSSSDGSSVNIVDSDGLKVTGSIAVIDGTTAKAGLSTNGDAYASGNIQVEGNIWNEDGTASTDNPTDDVMINDNLYIEPGHNINGNGSGVLFSDAAGVTINASNAGTGLIVNNTGTDGGITVNAASGGMTINSTNGGLTVNSATGGININSTSTGGLKFTNNTGLLTSNIQASSGTAWFKGKVTSDVGFGSYHTVWSTVAILPLGAPSLLVTCPTGEIAVSCLYGIPSSGSVILYSMSASGASCNFNFYNGSGSVTYTAWGGAQCLNPKI